MHQADTRREITSVLLVHFVHKMSRLFDSALTNDSVYLHLYIRSWKNTEFCFAAQVELSTKT